MTADEMRRALSEASLTQANFAEAIGVSERAVRAWVGGSRAVPEPVAKLLRLIVAGRLPVLTVREA